ncbi:MBL fold metallo-hydrolase [Xanthomarina sp. F2636L]|uniref:MBL fold metallo-hydrolase n=1 Tax=Xanthomarina sp. F2636L TaxID=2996018 RepID=UPI00225E54FA|nr:MBL fold metallo-hydrolase [Xanthomarina sp. F2636L]MCX7549786.1 MBL fold metallo-hydrolase [Xanthomarina sp. F2636L]
MRNFLLVLFLISILSFGCKGDVKDVNTNQTSKIKTDTISILDNKKPLSDIIVKPINHASFILEYEDIVIYVDPVGGPELYKNEKDPNVILITDIHDDHFNLETFEGIMKDTTQPIVPPDVAIKIPMALQYNMFAVKNNARVDYTKAGLDVVVYSVPMYNLREEALKYHPKGRGNGYVVEFGGKRIYISGDTEDIPEMRNLSNIDIAFVCMNLPYTMTVESAASAVLDFKPKKVYPYHYRGTEGFSDIEKFKSLVNEGNEDIEVILLDWYKNP